MSAVVGLVNDVVSGRRPLDIETTRRIIDSATSDRRIEDADELAPLRDLFVGDRVRADIQSTRGGAAFLRGFLLHAGALHADVGEVRSARTRELKPLAARFATNTLLSKEALTELISQYRGTKPDESFDRPLEPGQTTAVTVTPAWVEKTREHLVGLVETFMAGNRFQRLWQAMGESVNVDWRSQYNSPVKTFEMWLASRSEKRAPAGGQ